MRETGGEKLGREKRGEGEFWEGGGEVVNYGERI